MLSADVRDPDAPCSILGGQMLYHTGCALILMSSVHMYVSICRVMRFAWPHSA